MNVSVVCGVCPSRVPERAFAGVGAVHGGEFAQMLLQPTLVSFSLLRWVWRLRVQEMGSCCGRVHPTFNSRFGGLGGLGVSRRAAPGFLGAGW